MEDAETLETIDEVLAQAQEVQEVLDWLDTSYERIVEMGAPLIAVFNARGALQAAVKQLEEAALCVRLVAEREERILA